MGTNYYFRDDPPDLLPEGHRVPPEWTRHGENLRLHIGKRSAAGWYCYDCQETLTIGGREMIHHVGSAYERCPTCGQEKQRIGHNAAMVELGFAGPATTCLTGVQGVSSFSWAQEPEMVGVLLRLHAGDDVVQDEYGRTMTGQEFLDMLEHNCPIQFTDSLWLNFS